MVDGEQALIWGSRFDDVDPCISIAKLGIIPVEPLVRAVAFDVSTGDSLNGMDAQSQRLTSVML